MSAKNLNKMSAKIEFQNGDTLVLLIHRDISQVLEYRDFQLASVSVPFETLGKTLPFIGSFVLKARLIIQICCIFIQNWSETLVL